MSEIAKTKIVELKQYIRRRKGGQNIRVGVMYGQVVPDGSGEIAVGFSLCSKTDVFCPIHGEEIAFDRSLTYLDRAPYESFVDVDGAVWIEKDLIPESIKTELAVFIGRCERFFKDHKLVPWATLFYSDNKEAVEEFFKKLAEKKAVLEAEAAIRKALAEENEIKGE